MNEYVVLRKVRKISDIEAICFKNKNGKVSNIYNFKYAELEMDFNDYNKCLWNNGKLSSAKLKLYGDMNKMYDKFNYINGEMYILTKDYIYKFLDVAKVDNYENNTVYIVNEIDNIYMYYEERDFKDKNKFCIEDFDRKIKRHFEGV